ncbi:hypothetical protein CRG98_007197 [Punica granatum]|uniref:Uncharacterized protein n=1 Tax=Punica granatum TaxID=22663 RepID=A0A2I0KVF8_PUNGR|nr:hypothetical protein CRG98_007197 [Punica granatum]
MWSTIPQQGGLHSTRKPATNDHSGWERDDERRKEEILWVFIVDLWSAIAQQGGLHPAREGPPLMTTRVVSPVSLAGLVVGDSSTGWTAPSTRRPATNDHSGWERDDERR